MGVKYSQSESQELMRKLLANVSVADEITNQLSKGSRHLQSVVRDSSSGLSGAAYIAGADLFSKIDKLIQKYSEAVDDVRSDVTVYQNAESWLNGEPAIDEDATIRIIAYKKSDLSALENQLEANQQMLYSLPFLGSALEDWLSPYNNELRRQIEAVKQAIRKEEERLKNLYQFVSRTSGLFTDSLDAFNLAVRGISVFGKVTVDSAGYAHYPAGTDMKWLADLSENEFGSYSVSRPKNMSDADFADYVEKVNGQAKALEKEGWDKAGVASYLKYLDQHVATQGDPLKGVDTAYERLHIVGSDVFTFVVDQAFPDTQQGAKDTLDMLYKVLGAEIDAHHFLQLDNVMNGKYKFPTEKEDIEQYLKFTETYAKLIQDKYSKQDILDDPIDHQMRYWLDKPVVDYINDKLPVDEGETKLSAYLKWIEEMGLLAGNPDASLHNRTLEHDKVTHPKNEKITVGHIEIIFTHDGNETVSMWNHMTSDDTGRRYDSNPERYEGHYQNMANTDSANYSDPKIKNGKYQNSGDRHGKLDVDVPKKNEPELRLKAKEEYSKAHDYKTDLEKIRGGK